MQLRPVLETRELTYPKRLPLRRPGTFEVLKRAAAVACASGALLLGACYGSTPMGSGGGDGWTGGEVGRATTLTEVEQPPLPPEPEPLAGDVAAPGFTCGSIEEWAVGWAPGWFEGGLCADEVAYGAMNVSEPGGYRITLNDGSANVLLSIVSPDDVEVAQLGPEQPSVELDLTEGRWVFEATPIDPDENPYAWFSVDVSRLED